MPINEDTSKALANRIGELEELFKDATVGDHYTEIFQYVKNLRRDFAPGKPGDPQWKKKMLSIAAVAIHAIEHATEWDMTR